MNNNDIKEIVPIDSDITKENFDEVKKPAKKRGRPPGSRNSSRGGTPSRGIHGYNLRQRKQNQTFNGFDQGYQNPILEVESPDSFCKMVVQMAKVSKVKDLNFSVENDYKLPGIIF